MIKIQYFVSFKIKAYLHDTLQMDVTMLKKKKIERKSDLSEREKKHIYRF